MTTRANSDLLAADDGSLLTDGLRKTGGERRQEVSDVIKRMRLKQALERSRYLDATDSEYWFALCFQSREQKEQFLAALGWADLGDKYLDGAQVARRMNVQLGQPPPISKPRKNRTWAALVRKGEG